MAAISKMIPCKTHHDISIMILRYKRIAQNNDKNFFKEDAPIDRWTNIIRQNSEYNILCPVARAIKYIKLFEQHYCKAELDNVNISECYDLLSKLSEGVTPKALNNETQYFLVKLLKDTAREVNNDRNKDSAVSFLKKISLSSLSRENKKTYGKRKNVEDVDPALNPLKVPITLYKKRYNGIDVTNV